MRYQVRKGVETIGALFCWISGWFLAVISYYQQAPKQTIGACWYNNYLMSGYDFKTLSPIDFENLIRDLLQKELKLTLESFKSGKDRGIDLRYSRSADYNLVVQCKHYAESTFDTLLRYLRNIELPKVRLLKPTRYILTVSLGLTVGQKERLVALFSPFVQAPGDVYGRDDINNLLGKFKEIERSHFKLWLTSVSTLEAILHSRIINASRDLTEKILRHAKYYVQNESFPEALDILNEHNFCIIAGNPGIGKTILAEMLSLHYVRLGYEIVKITSHISEAHALAHSEQPRIYYYDDFLGQTSLADKLNKNEDQSLIDFIAAIQRSRNSKLILTTREYILNQARRTHEKLARSDFRIETYVIDLSKYSRLHRAQILFNHLYFSNLPKEHVKELLAQKDYLKVIDHPNYSPRIIDFMTQSSRVKGLDPGQYVEHFLRNLTNPIAIWQHAFEEQLTRAARNLLIVMTTMPERVFENDLCSAFECFHKRQATELQLSVQPQDFKRALKELDGNFIANERSRDKIILRLHNPSIRDFLQNYLETSEADLLALIGTAPFFEQMMWVWKFKDRGHASFRQTIAENASIFVAGLKRAIKAPTSRTTAYWGPGQPYIGTWVLSFEARVAFLVSVLAEQETVESAELLSDALGQVLLRLKSSEVKDREDLVDLVTSLKRSAPSFLHDKADLLKQTKAFLADELYLIEDAEPFCKLYDDFPELVDESDLDKLQAEIRCIIANYEAEDADYVREDITTLQSISRRLGIGLEKEISRLESWADDLEAKTEARGDDRPKQSKLEDQSCTNEDIESLFSLMTDQA